MLLADFSLSSLLSLGQVNYDVNKKYLECETLPADDFYAARGDLIYQCPQLTSILVSRTIKLCNNTE